MKVLVKFSIFFTFIFASLILSQSHPRLFYNANDISNIRTRCTTYTSPPTPAYQLWQLMKERQADWFKDPRYQNRISGDPWQMENLFSVALGYIITNDISYREAVRNIVLGGGLIDPIDALVNVVPFAYKDDYIQWSEEFYRTTQIQTLSLVADIMWNSFSDSERVAIGYKVAAEIDAELHSLVFSPSAAIDNNHIARHASALGYAAITFKDLFDADHYRYVYPQAESDLNRVISLLVTNLN